MWRLTSAPGRSSELIAAAGRQLAPDALIFRCESEVTTLIIVDPREVGLDRIPAELLTAAPTSESIAFVSRFGGE